MTRITPVKNPGYPVQQGSDLLLGRAGWANGQMEAIVAARSRYDGQNA
jgi:putative AlgH/UPF0301 family transcriptional regulator